MNVLNNVVVKGYGNIANHILMVSTSDGSFLVDERQIPEAWILLEEGAETFVSFEWEVGHRGDDFIRKFLPKDAVQAAAAVMMVERRAIADLKLSEFKASEAHLAARAAWRTAQGEC